MHLTRRLPSDFLNRLQKEKSMNMIGVCGDNCSFCPRYLASLSGDVEELEDVKELWVRLGLRDPVFPARDMACFGCRPENNCAYSDVRACAHGKGIDNCGLCQVYPCRMLIAVFEKSEMLRSFAARVCTPNEMDVLHKAFLSKRQNLDQIRFRKDKDREKYRPCRHATGIFAETSGTLAKLS